MQAIIFLMQKEFRQIFRDSMMVRLIFFAPILQLVILSYAADRDLKMARLSVLDLDRTQESRQLIEAFENTSNDLFVLDTDKIDNHKQLKRKLERGQTDIALYIPQGYARDITNREGTSVGIYVDGSNSSMAGQSNGYAMRIVRKQSEKYMDEMLDQNPVLKSKLHLIDTITRYFYNPELVSQFYMVPAIIVLLVTTISAFMSGMAIVKEKEVGTFEQLMVTPIKSWQFIAGKTLPFAILSYLEIFLAMTVGILWFKIPMAGSVWLLMFGAALYLVVNLGGGLLASTVSKTQQQSMFTVWFFLVFGMLTSGFFFPVRNMPEIIQIVTYANPIRFFMNIVRGIFLKNASLFDLKEDFMVLTIIGLIVFIIAILRFQKRSK